MTNTLIFSENNPARLRLLLQSIQKHDIQKNVSLNVIHRSLNSDYEPLYEKLKTEFANLNINWTGYSNFKEMVLKLAQNNSDYTMFLKDDNVFYSSVDFEQINQTFIKFGEEIISFSLKLGKNTKICRAMNTANTLFGEKEIIDGNVISWNWQKHFLDYSNPFSDGSIFRTKELLKMLKQVHFNNIEEIEENMSEVFEFYPKSEMASFVNSVLVRDIAGPDKKQINELWMNDKPIELSELNFNNTVDGCDAYIPKPEREQKIEEISKTEENA